MKKLSELVQDVEVIRTWGDPEVEIASVCYDSRKVKEKTAFVAMRGASADGHRFITQAWEKGAAAVVAEDEAPADLSGAWVQTPNSRRALGAIGAAFFDHPSDDLKVAGITGTNGKTTTAFLTQHVLNAAHQLCGLMGTVYYDNGARRETAVRTTPESLDVHQLLAEMRDEGCRAAAMEVSSHGLDQYRVQGVDFNVGIFTNLSQDHLDYHGSMENYFKSKLKLFEQVGASKKKGRRGVVVNGDDPYGARILKLNLDGTEFLSYGMGSRCDFRATDVKTEFSGTVFKLFARGRQFLVRLPLIGRFNVYNALAALGAGSVLGLNLRESVANLAQAPQVPGRMEAVGESLPFRVFVDYAHTPDAVEKACAVLRELKPNRLITVFGCGGDRDRAKRPLMAKAACRHSDAIVVTSDNPRSEDPGAIIRDIEKGIRGVSHITIEDRKEAIHYAIENAADRDVVLIAGKGHETYQQFADKTIDFDDRQVARHAINDWLRSRGEQ